MRRRKNSPQDALKDVRRFLKYRARSVAEVVRKLSDFGYDQEVIDKTVETLKKTGEIDDEEFAYIYASDMLTVYGYGPFAIRRKLTQLGIDEETALSAIDRVLSENDLNQVMLKILTLHKVSKGKIKDFLARRGFSYDQIRGLNIEGGA